MTDRRIADRYTLHSMLGAGGMGTVYRATDSQSGATVAVKYLKPAMSRPDLIERFKREGEALRDLNHPNIVKMLDAVEEDGDHFLVMEYVSGGDLSDLLKQGALPLERVIGLSIDLADALTRAHKLNIIHRDLKPGNVLIGEDGVLRLTDFGVAHVGSKERVTDTDAIVGTIDYLPPEAFDGKPFDARGDIWAFGVMLFEMLSGQRPFAGETLMDVMHNIIREPIPNLEELAPDAPVALVDLVYRMLERDPNARIASVRHVGAALEDIFHGRNITVERRFVANVSNAMARPTHNLPAQTTAFVGREAELRELTRLLIEPSIRLVTVVAPGGMGKTRLSIEGGLSILPSFNDGVYFVELAPLRSADAIVPAIAEATGFQFVSDERSQKQQVLDFLANKQMLLILDNFEHLLDGTPLVGEILSAAPDVQILATSRERLNQSGESLLILEGMDFPKWETPDDAVEYAAVKLFLQSARRIQPDFEITYDNMDYVARICKLVQGLPLGILLAASWLSMLEPEEIAAEIQSSVDFLESELGDLPDRQRSMRAVFDYSWDLMSAPEQDSFMRLAVFRGGFTRKAGQAISGASLRTLMTLVNKSLVSRDAETGRYSIHELTRQYAKEKLEQSPHDNATRDAHMAYYLTEVAALLPSIRGHGQVEALDNIESEFENVRLAWMRGVERKDAIKLADASESINHFGTMRSRRPDVNALMEAAVAMPFEANTSALRVARAQLLIWSAHYREHTDEATTALLFDRLQEAQQLLDDPELDASDYERFLIIYVRSLMLSNQRKHAEAAEAAHVAHEIAEAAGEMVMMARSNHLLGYVIGVRDESSITQTDEPHGMRYVQRSLELFEELGNKSFMATQLNNLSAQAMYVGDFAQAEVYSQQALEIRRASKNRGQIAWSHNMLGNINVVQGNLEKAAYHYEQAVVIGRELGLKTRLTSYLSAQAYVAMLQSQPERAVALSDESVAVAMSTGNLYLQRSQTAISASVHVVTGMAQDSRKTIQDMVPFLRTEADGMASWAFGTAVVVILATEGEAERAVEIAGTTMNIAVLEASTHLVLAKTLDSLRESLGDDAFEAALARGREQDFGATMQALMDEFFD